jgi:transposase
MTTVAHSTCETLEVIPARVVVIQRLDETVACPHDNTIVSAPTPPQIVERGKLGDGLIVEALADKYIEHLSARAAVPPLERSAVQIAPQTLGRSVAAAIDLLAPISKLIRDMTREHGILSMDASGIPILDPAAPEGIREPSGVGSTSGG